MKHNIFIQSCAVILAITMSLSTHARLIGFVSDAENPQLISIDSEIGLSSSIAPIDPAYWIISSLAYDLNHDILYAVFPGSDDQLLTIDMAKGEIESIGLLGDPFRAVHGLAYDTKRDILYGMDDGDDQLVSIDVNTGVTTMIGLTDRLNLSSLAYDSKRDALFSVPTDRSTPALWMIDRETGESIRVGLLGFDVEGFRSLTYHPEEDVLYGVDLEHDFLVRINPDTGEATPVGNEGAVGYDLIRGLTYIPEPGMLAILSVGGMLLVKRRRS